MLGSGDVYADGRYHFEGSLLGGEGIGCWDWPGCSLDVDERTKFQAERLGVLLSLCGGAAYGLKVLVRSRFQRLRIVVNNIIQAIAVQMRVRLVVVRDHQDLVPLEPQGLEALPAGFDHLLAGWLLIRSP
jgi:hypothetical protein